MPINYDQSGVVYDSTVYTWDGEVRTSTVFPIVGVFVAFSDGPYTANPGWQEITPYVRAVSTHRGRSNDLEQFETGTAQLVLDNRDRRFDPFYTSGPYYTKLTPRRQIRIVGQIGGSNYDVFRGYIAGWPVTWSDAGKDSTVTIQCFDALGLMANETVPTDWIGYYTTSLNPYRYFRCSDAASSKILKDVNNADYLALNTIYAIPPPSFFQYQPLGAGFSAPAAYCPDYNNFNNSTYPTAPVTGDTDFTVSVWVQYLAGASSTNPQIGQVTCQYGGRALSANFYYAAQTSPAKAQFSLYMRSSSTVAANSYEYVSQFSASTSQPMHIAMTYTAASNAAKIYINGVDQTGTSTASGASLLYTDRTIFQILNAAIQDLALFPRVLSTTEIGNIFSYGIAQISESTTARMNRLIATTDYPTLLTAFTASPAATVAEIGTGANVIPEMQLVADSEGGELYVNKSGILTTTNRTDVFTATRSATSQATITDSGAGLKYGTELNIQYDADNLKNDVTVNYSGGGQVEVYNDATIAGYGAASTVIETQLADPTSANQLALMELGVEGSLIPQISPIDLSPNTVAADWQTILGLELLDRVTFKRTPTVGNQFNRDALINAIDHQIAPGVWNTQVTLSMRYTSPLTCDDPVLGRVDYNYCG